MMQEAPLPERARRRLLAFAAVRPPSSGTIAAPSAPVVSSRESLAARAGNWLAHRDPTFWALFVVALVALLLRLYGINWDANNHLHPDEREIVFKAMCLSLPGAPRIGNCDPAYTGPGWLLSPSSPLNPHFFAYGSFPLYLLAAVCHALAWLSHLTGGRFLPPDGGAWDDFNHFTLVGRALSALFDVGSVVLAGLITRRLAGRWAALLAAAFVATIPFEVQVAHFYAVDTVMLFFVMLTLYGCVLLAQAAGAPSQQERSAAGQWWAWRLGVLLGLAYALAIATKVSALPLAAPIVVALLLCWRRFGTDAMLLAFMGIVSTGLIAYIVVSPYTFLDWKNFQQQVSEQTMLSQGQLDYPYVRQFADATNYVYPLKQLLLYDMGLPLGLLGLAGFIWAVSRLWRALNTDWLILVTWLAVYFGIVGGAYMKFTRYMLPVFAGLAICGAAALAALSAWGVRRLRAASEHAGDAGLTRPWWRRDPLQSRLAQRATALWGVRWWRGVALALALGVLLASSFATLALLNIYSQPNTRVQASVWIYDHVPAGSLLTNEVWDDPLPILAPPARVDKQGNAYTASGAIINPGQYQQIGLNLYDDDTPQKADQLAQSLASANVVVISSQRLLKSIPKLPDRYPMTTRYYQLLFAGKLGFKLAAHFENHPNLLGITLDDSGADESFSVYDHPPVWIFVREGAGLTQAQLTNALTAGLFLPAASHRSGSQKSLLLSPQDAAADSQSQPLGVQFPAGSLANTIPLFWWLLIVELLGVVSFPLAYSAFPGLRDRGWGLSKLLGLLILAWAIWLPSSLRLLPFDRWAVVLLFGVLTACGAVVAWLRREAIWSFVQARWRLLLVGEIFFLVAFLFFVWIRALDPDLWHIYRGGEKPMELAFLNGILRSRYMPPLDPWFSGGYINYYYYGQFLIAVLIKLTGIAPTTAFNLAIPLLFGLTCSAAYSVVAGMTGRWWAGLMGGVALAVAGNLDGLLQLIGQLQAALAGQIPPLFDYWRSSRVIPFTINEFPYWSFLYADLHAHLIDLPIVVLIIAACGSLLRGASIFGPHWRSVVPTLAVIALALGAAWCTNTWDLPTYGLLVALVLALRLLPSGAGFWKTLRSLRWPAIRNLALAAGLTFVGAYALYLPFHANFQNFVSGTGPVTTPTNAFQFVTLFGLWLFLAGSFFFLELRGRIERIFGGAAGAGATQRLLMLALASVLALLLAFAISVKALLLVFLAVGVYLALDGRHAPLKRLTYLVLLLGLAVAFGVEVIYVRDFLDNSDWERMNTVFKFYYQVWTLLALGGALALSQILGRIFPQSASEEAEPPVEEDAAEQNGHAGASDTRAPSHVRSGWPAIVRGGMRIAWALAFAGLLFGSSVFLVEGTRARVNDPAIWAAVQPPPGGVQPQGLSLDGMAYMRGWYPGDYAAITWLNDHIAGAPVIVEASNGPYAWYSRVSIYTGLPDVLGWSSHESQQRYGDQVYARQADVQAFYGGNDPASAASFLRQYGVSYVYIGGLERTCYMTNDQGACVPMSSAALDKFTTLAQAGVLRAVYQTSDVVIYQVVGA